VYDRGERYFRDGKIISFALAEDVNAEPTIRSTVQGHYKNYDVTVTLDTKGGVKTYGCSCESHSIWRGACKHVVSVLFAHAEGSTRFVSASRMRRYVNELTTKLENIVFENINETFKLPALVCSGVKLMPTLHSTGRNSLYLTFSIGQLRMYLIKNIAQFVESFNTGEEIKYGDALTLVHKQEFFDSNSQELLNFIFRETNIITETGNRLGRQFQITPSSITASRELHLTERNIDSFFDLFNGRTIEAATDFGKEVALLEQVPGITLNVKYSETELQVKADSFEYRSFKGGKYHYFLSGNKFYRMPKAGGLVLDTLIAALKETPALEISMAGADMQKFVSVILPALKQAGVTVTEEGTPELAPPLTTKLFFDAEKKDITCRVQFCYGSISIDPFSTEVTEITRNLSLEYTIIRVLESKGFIKNAKKGLYRLKSDDLAFQFLSGKPDNGIENIKEFAEIFVSDKLQKKAAKAAAPGLGLRLSGNLLQVSMDDNNYNITELMDVLESYRLRKKYHRLKDGSFLSLDEGEVVDTVNFLDSLDISTKQISGNNINLPAYKALYASEIGKNIKKDKGLSALLSHFDVNTKPKFKVPKGMGAILREYQKTGYCWLKTLAHFNFGGILADDMGLGKTLQVITLLASDKKGVSLVVCPTSLLFNWQNEIMRFAPGLKSQIISGTPEKRSELIQQSGCDVFITTYDMLKRDIEQYQGLEFNYCIADEAQNIKNPATQAAKAVKQINSRVRFALTGTPIENTLSELWSIFDFIMPGFLHSLHKFVRVYETPIIKHNCPETAAKLRKQISPFVLRRIKQNVLTELPEKTEKTLQAEMTPEQKKIYQANLLDAIGLLDKTDNKVQILAQLTRLRQACCHPSLFLDGYKGGSGKLALAIETIQIAIESGHRVLLFSQFTSMLELIKAALSKAEIATPDKRQAKYFYLDGSIKAKERMDMTERFNAGEGELFLISLKAGGVGLNLTGADVVIHFDPWWNPSVMDQASDRAHRYGQEKVVQVINIVAKDSIEEKIMELQDKKRDLIDSVVTEGGSFISLLSEDEVRKLFAE